VGRPVGHRIREVLEITESRGTANTTEIRLAMSGRVESANVAKYCSRAVGLGLMTADRSNRQIRYEAVTGWRELVRPPKPKQPQPQAEPPASAETTIAHALRTQPNSVFALARPGGCL